MTRHGVKARVKHCHPSPSANQQALILPVLWGICVQDTGVDVTGVLGRCPSGGKVVESRSLAPVPSFEKNCESPSLLIEERFTLTDSHRRKSHRHIRDARFSDHSLNLFVRFLTRLLFRQLGYLSPTVTNCHCCAVSDVFTLV